MHASYSSMRNFVIKNCASYEIQCGNFYFLIKLNLLFLFGLRNLRLSPKFVPYDFRNQSGKEHK